VPSAEDARLPRLHHAWVLQLPPMLLLMLRLLPSAPPHGPCLSAALHHAWPVLRLMLRLPIRLLWRLWLSLLHKHAPWICSGALLAHAVSVPCLPLLLLPRLRLLRRSAQHVGVAAVRLIIRSPPPLLLLLLVRSAGAACTALLMGSAASFPACSASSARVR